MSLAASTTRLLGRATAAALLLLGAGAVSCLPAASEPVADAHPAADGTTAPDTASAPDAQATSAPPVPDAATAPDAGTASDAAMLPDITPLDGPTGTLRVDLTGMTPPLLTRAVVWDVEVLRGASAVVARGRVTAHGASGELLHASFDAPCDASASATTHTVTVRTVGVYQEQVDAPGSFGSPPPAGAQVPLIPSVVVVGATCSPDEVTTVPVISAPALGVSYAHPSSDGVYEVAGAYDGVSCHAEVRCCAGAHTDGACTSYLSWFPPVDGVEGSVLTWHAHCFDLEAAGGSQDVDPGDPPHLFFDDVVLDCGAAGVVAVDPTARETEPYCDTFGGADEPPVGCVGIDGVETGLVRQAQAHRMGTAPGSTFSVALKLLIDRATMAAGDCRLRGRMASVRHAESRALLQIDEPSASGAYELPPNAAWPVLTWDVELGRNGAFVCGDTGQVTTPQVQVRDAEANEPPFSRRLIPYGP